jgi:peptidoglycan hydrolase-like protein with peptidoglycan-binding domain
MTMNRDSLYQIQRHKALVVALVFTVSVITGLAYAPAVSAKATGNDCVRKPTLVELVYASGNRIQRTKKRHYQVLHVGSQGKCVQRLQAMLNKALGKTGTSKLAVDGYFGSNTRKAVEDLQRLAHSKNWFANGKPITIDGVVGPQTWALAAMPHSVYVR